MGDEMADLNIRNIPAELLRRFKSAVALEDQVTDPIEEDLLKDTVRLILSFQNKDGGWATYENQRGGKWLELLNPSQVFSDIMVDYSCVECTSACIQALDIAKQRFPKLFDRDIDKAIRRGIGFIQRKQRMDGSWEGSWGVCYIYGTWFAVSGLLAAGVSHNASAIRQACGFLFQRQNQDGGWGEHHTSCMMRHYVRDKKSHSVHTAWALMTLVRAGLAQSIPAKRAARFLLETQQENGDWPVDPLVGVFNKSTLINYENYRHYFPLWALGEFDNCYN